MKSLLALLLLAALGALAYKTMYKREAAPMSEADKARFLSSCRQVASVRKIDAYCRCLVAHGVRDLVSLQMKAKSREADQACRAAGGEATPSAAGSPAPAGNTAPGRGPAPTGRGINADHLGGQLREAYKRRPAP